MSKVYTISKTTGMKTHEDNKKCHKLDAVSNFMNVNLDTNYVGDPGYDMVTYYKGTDEMKVKTLLYGMPSPYLSKDDPLNDIMPIDVEYHESGKRAGHIKSLKFITFTNRGYDALLNLKEKLDKDFDKDYIEYLCFQLTD